MALECVIWFPSASFTQHLLYVIVFRSEAFCFNWWVIDLALWFRSVSWGVAVWLLSSFVAELLFLIAGL